MEGAAVERAKHPALLRALENRNLSRAERRALLHTAELWHAELVSGLKDEHGDKEAIRAADALIPTLAPALSELLRAVEYNEVGASRRLPPPLRVTPRRRSACAEPTRPGVQSTQSGGLPRISTGITQGTREGRRRRPTVRPLPLARPRAYTLARPWAGGLAYRIAAVALVRAKDGCWSGSYRQTSRGDGAASFSTLFHSCA